MELGIWPRVDVLCVGRVWSRNGMGNHQMCTLEPYKFKKKIIDSTLSLFPFVFGETLS